MKRFAFELRRRLGWGSLSRETIYRWERCRSPVPAQVLVAAAEVSGLSVDELLQQAYEQLETTRRSNLSQEG